MLTDEKFYERAQKFTLLKNTDGKYFTLDEYKDIIKDNQTDKDNQLVYIYATDAVEQYSFIEAAKNKGLDVLLMDGQLDTHFINHLEQKFENSRFVRVDSDVPEKLVPKEDQSETKLSEAEKDNLTVAFSSQVPNMEKAHFVVSFESLSSNDKPVMITQQEFMRRMKEMSQTGGGGPMMFAGDMPDSYNLVVNDNHELIQRVSEECKQETGETVDPLREKIESLESRKSELEKSKEDKKEEEVPQQEKEELDDVEKKLTELRNKKDEALKSFASKNKLVSQLIDLALLSNNMLKGEALNRFVKRSIDLI
jgi:molecular chaperone HtpG